jgi:hypothetical protein
MKACALLLLGCIVAGPMHAQHATLSPRVEVVRQLYSEFACEAVVDAPGCDEQHELADQPRDVLGRYFDDRLTTLWLADRDCARRTRQICALDFSPIWDSQDPTGTYVRIVAAADSSHVDVALRGPASQGLRKLRYTLVQTASGWRIRDIDAPSKWSLVRLLSGKH